MKHVVLFIVGPEGAGVQVYDATRPNRACKILVVRLYLAHTSVGHPPAGDGAYDAGAMSLQSGVDSALESLHSVADSVLAALDSLIRVVVDDRDAQYSLFFSDADHDSRLHLGCEHLIDPSAFPHSLTLSVRLCE